MSQMPENHSREPAINLPAVVSGTIVLLGIVHLYRSAWLTPAEDAALIFDYALIPARWSMALFSDGPAAVLEAIRSAGGRNMPGKLALAGALIREGGAHPWTALTHAFLHDSWMHFGFNAIWLAVFGAPLARRWGSGWFILFAAVTAVAGALVHFAGQPYSVIPTIGASGAVSGLFGAAAWYVFDRRSGGVSEDLVHRRRFALADIIRNPTTVAFIVFWFIGNYLFALLPGGFAGEHVEIAWQAHMGGFLGGFLLFPLIDDFRRKAENP